MCPMTRELFLTLQDPVFITSVIASAVVTTRVRPPAAKLQTNLVYKVNTSITFTGENLLFCHLNEILNTYAFHYFR